MIPWLIFGGGGVAVLTYAVWAYLKGPRCRFTSGRQCRAAVIGDSISAGYGYVDLLASVLPQYSFDVYGGVGWGTAALLEELQSAVVPQNFDEIIIEGGINDLGRANVKSYILDNLHQMVRAAKGSGARVVLLTLTPWADAADTIESINRSLKWMAPFWGVDEVVDAWSPLADAQGGLRSELIGDQMGVHPNAAGHQLLAQAVHDEAY